MLCCKQFLHEHCLLSCFQNDPYGRHRCPYCRGTLLPINKEDAVPPEIPQDLYLFKFEYILFAPKSAEEIADEISDTIYVPIAPPVKP